jgi:hypothetical protein
MLVALVQRALAPEGAIVRESHLVDAKGEKQAREIDVLIETKVGEYRIKIAVEAKDEGRPMDSTKFESIMGKYLVEGGIKVNKIVIVTHRGFYEPVVERAKKLDVDLLTLTEAQEIDWSAFRPPGPCFETRPRICDIQFAPEICVVSKEKVLQDGLVVCSCGRHHGSLEQYATFLFWKTVVQKYRDLLLKLDNEAIQSGSETRARVEISLAAPHEPVVEIDGQRFPLAKISFDVRCRKEDQPTPAMPAHIQISLAPHLCRIGLVPPIENEDPVVVQKEGRIICQCCGKNHGTIAEWAYDMTMRRFLPSNKQAQEMLQKGVRESPNGHANLEVSWPLCKNWRVRFRDQDYPVTHVKVSIHAAGGKAPLECKQYDLANADGSIRRLSQMQATVGGKTMTLILPDGTSSKRIALRIADANHGNRSKKAAKLRRERAKREKRRSKKRNS